MINKFTLGNTFCIAGVITFLMLMTSCMNEGTHKPDIADVRIEQPFLRFDKELFSSSGSMSVAEIQNFRDRFGLFFDLFCSRVLRIPGSNDTLIADYLSQFKNDPDVQMLYHLSDSVFGDAGEVIEQLNSSFRYYHYYFPEKTIPRIITYISAFNYQVITADSILGISLDMYLGGDKEEMYGSVGFPKYMFSRFSKPYVPVDCMKGWFQSEYDADSVKNELLSQMIYHGKMMYFLDCVLPDYHDTLKIGYSKAQLDWCVKNESNIWAHLIEQKLLFSANKQEYFKYINDGPTTNGLPKESPAKIGVWIGWKIVKSCMNKNPEKKLPELLLENDAQKILNESGYKPER